MKIDLIISVRYILVIFIDFKIYYILKSMVLLQPTVYMTLHLLTTFDVTDDNLNKKIPDDTS